VKRQPTSVSVASLSDAEAVRASEVFHQPWFRWYGCLFPFALGYVIDNTSISYTGNDPIGLELAGALKNVYALAAGMSDGMGYENNTRASERFDSFELLSARLHV
jgi:glycerol-3-phosphate dehydrogenase